MTLSPHFTRSEFACKCGCGFDTVDHALLEALEALRQHFNSPVRVGSGCRCKAHNKAVGGSKRSQHMQGRAADITVDFIPPQEVAEFAKGLGLSVGTYNNFTHIDSRSGTPRHWEG